MRGADEVGGAPFGRVDPEARIPACRPRRENPQVVNAALARPDGEFEAPCMDFGRPSMATGRLIRASLIAVLFPVRSGRQVMEQMQRRHLFRWFAGLGIDDPVRGDGHPEICPVDGFQP